ncbi:MAG: 3-oxoacyl-[acyl-carrier-protein] reductase [Nitrospinae bacterium]|nr:3-oxoacyl-[acyl-carrier-protein] reductase [Nitrospinota bacterium]
MGQLDGKIAIITGAGTGIGKGIARAFAREGATLVIASRNESNLQRTADELRPHGATVEVVPTDVSEESTVVALFEHTMQRFDRLDILVNNAGVFEGGPLEELTLAAWQKVMDVNLTGTWLCSQAALKVMLKQRAGRIINISSVVGVMGNVGQANYAASKAGVIGLTKALAREGALREVTVNAIAPGFIDTAMTQALPEKIREELLSHIPLGRLGSPEDVAHAVLFLAGDGACYITGQVIHINGGMLMP